MSNPISSSLTMSSAGQGWLVLGGLAVAAVAASVACSGKDLEPGYDAVAEAMLVDVGPRVVEPALTRFLVTLDALDGALAAWDATSGGSGQADAQFAWANTMAAWQELEMFQLGPAASSLTAVAGEDFRDEIYSWPTIDGCGVDELTASGEFRAADFLEESLVDVRGLDALEHLLFASDSPACNDASDVEAAWVELGLQGVQAARAEQAVVVASGVRADAEELAQRWSAAGGDFGSALAKATPYESQSDAVNAVFDALFYLELGTKDRKLGRPLGYRDCSSDRCPDAVEHRLAGESTTAIAQNLVAFRELYTGGGGTGLYDLIVSAGESSLADAMLTELGQAEEAAASVSSPVDETINSDPDAIATLYDELKDVTDLLKGPVSTVLLLQIPAEATGDAD